MGNRKMNHRTAAPFVDVANDERVSRETRREFGEAQNLPKKFRRKNKSGSNRAPTVMLWNAKENRTRTTFPGIIPSIVKACEKVEKANARKAAKAAKRAEKKAKKNRSRIIGAGPSTPTANSLLYSDSQLRKMGLL